MSRNPLYTFDLVDSDSMQSIIVSIGSMTGRTFKPVFNGPGSFSFTTALDSAVAYKAVKRKTGIVIFRNKRAIWSGGITSIAKDPAAETCAIEALGWLEELDHRYVRKGDEQYMNFPTPTVGGLIIQTFINLLNTHLDSNGNVRPVRIKSGSIGDTQTRVRAYKQGDNFGSSIKELSEIENGCDILVDPLTRKISTRAPNSYSVLSRVQFGYAISPNNLENAIEVDDGTSVRNRVNVVASNGIVYAFDDNAAINSAGVMLEDWLSLSNLNDPTGTIPAAYANAELVYKRYGNKTYSLTPVKYGDFPRPYDDFEWGDQGYLSIDKHSLQVKSQAIRLFSATINIDDNGNEIITDLTVTAS